MLSNQDLLNLTGKVTIVTGGAAGIGYGIAARLAEAGASVVIADIDGAKATISAASLMEKGLKAFDYQLDIADEGSVKTLMDFVASRFGTLDILINNAGIYPWLPIAQMTSADFDRIMGVNLRGAFLCLKYASEKMIASGNGGRIINLTSTVNEASKHGLLGLTKSAALEYAPHKITINSVAPGMISTPGTSNVQGVDPAKLPLQRQGDIDEIGKVVLFLASDMSSYMTGTEIVVDGGELLS